MKSFQSLASRSAQSGAVLLVAVVLLLLAGVMTLAALNVGVFEQRSTGNDIRAKEVNEIAEAGLAQGFEYLMRQHPDMMEDDTLWEKCTAGDTKFPCGAVSDAPYDNDADSTTAAVARRSTMFRLKASGHVDSNFDAAMTPAMLNLSSNIGTAGNEAKTIASRLWRRTGAVLCRGPHPGRSGDQSGALRKQPRPGQQPPDRDLRQRRQAAR